MKVHNKLSRNFWGNVFESNNLFSHFLKVFCWRQKGHFDLTNFLEQMLKLFWLNIFPWFLVFIGLYVSSRMSVVNSGHVTLGAIGLRRNSFVTNRATFQRKKSILGKIIHFKMMLFVKLLSNVEHLGNLWKSDVHHQYLHRVKLVSNSSPSKVFDSNSIDLECRRHCDQCQLAEFCVYGRSSAP